MFPHSAGPRGTPRFPAPTTLKRGVGLGVRGQGSAAGAQGPGSAAGEDLPAAPRLIRTTCLLHSNVKLRRRAAAAAPWAVTGSQQNACEDGGFPPDPQPALGPGRGLLLTGPPTRLAPSCSCRAGGGAAGVLSVAWRRGARRALPQRRGPPHPQPLAGPPGRPENAGPPAKRSSHCSSILTIESLEY